MVSDQQSLCVLCLCGNGFQRRTLRVRRFLWRRTLIRLRHPFDSHARSGQAFLPSLSGEGRLRHGRLECPSPRDSGERVPKAGEGPFLVLTEGQWALNASHHSGTENTEETDSTNRCFSGCPR